MAPSAVDPNSAPPGYTSQRDAISPLQSVGSTRSTEDQVSARSLPLPTPSIDSATPRRSDAHFNDVSPLNPVVRGGMNQRYSSLPYENSVTFPVHLRYSHVPTSFNSTAAASELPPDSPNFSLHQKMASRSTLRLNPTNYVSLSRKSTPRKRFLSLYRSRADIKGAFTVNPYLHIPAALLSPTNTRDEPVRKNLKFEVENGGINVNIFLVGDHTPGNDGMTLRTTLDLKLRGGAKNRFPLIAKIHTPSLLRPSFYLTALGLDGYHSFHLPPSFHGLVTIKVPAGDLDAHISLSSCFTENSMILSETSTTRSYFVGELGGWSRDKQDWEGDKVDVSIGEGMVRLQILGERDRDFFRRLWWKMGL